MTEVGLTFQLTKRSANPLNHSMGSRLTHRAMNWNWTDPARAEVHRNKTSSRPESHGTEFTTGWGTKREAPRPNPNAVTVSRRHRASHPPPPRPRAPHTPPTSLLLYPACSPSLPSPPAFPSLYTHLSGSAPKREEDASCNGTRSRATRRHHAVRAGRRRRHLTGFPGTLD